MPKQTAVLTQPLVIPQNLNQPAGVSRPQLLLMETAVHHPNHSPFPKNSTTNPRHNFQNLRQNQIAVLRTGASVPRRKVGRICGSFQSLHRQECSNFCPPPSKPVGLHQPGAAFACCVQLRWHSTQRPRPDLPQHRTLASGLKSFVQARLVSPNLVFNVQTANFDAGKPFPTKTSASREHWKSNLAFSCQLLRQVPKTLPGLFEQNPPRLWQNTGQPTSKNYLDGKPALTPPSGALARSAKTSTAAKTLPSEDSRQRHLDG
jgi:hypothetical protein